MARRGAICDTMTKQAIMNAGLEIKHFRDDNETQTLFEKAGNYLLTGDTGSMFGPDHRDERMNPWKI